MASNEPQSEQSTKFAAPRASSGRKGRPSVVIERSQLQSFCDQGFTAKQMAKTLQCSYSVVRKKLQEENLQMKNKFTDLSDTDLNASVKELHSQFPNAGCEIMTGLLRSQGVVVQRRKVRSALRCADPDAVERRRTQTTARRTYSVPTPNSMWHLDGHMKLIRWGFVTHGCIDGYSRLVVYLATDSNNKARTVLNLFVQSSYHYGLPSRVRSDHGGENIDVAMFMNLVRGTEAHSHITGKSVHNERIERLWRDVFNQVIQLFYSKFCAMENQGILNPNEEKHIIALHLVYLPLINDRLTTFRQAWNKHRIRTEGHKTPEQLWTEGMLVNQNTNHVAVEEIFGNTPSLGIRLEDALRSFNLDASVFTQSDSSLGVESASGLSEETIATIRQQIQDIEDYTLKFQKAVDILSG